MFELRAAQQLMKQVSSTFLKTVFLFLGSLLVSSCYGKPDPSVENKEGYFVGDIVNGLIDCSCNKTVEIWDKNEIEICSACLSGILRDAGSDSVSDLAKFFDKLGGYCREIEYQPRFAAHTPADDVSYLSCRYSFVTRGEYKASDYFAFETKDGKVRALLRRGIGPLEAEKLRTPLD